MRWWWTKTNNITPDADGVQDDGTASLAIVLKDRHRSVLSFSHPVVLKEDQKWEDIDPLEEFKDIYDWYTDGVTSKYTFRYDTGMYVFNREDILYLCINLKIKKAPE